MRKDPFVEWMQQRLIASGFNPGSPDGIFGRKTLGALQQFQKAHSIPVTGKADAATVLALRTDAPPTVGKAPDRTPEAEFPWMGLALQKKGLRETDPDLKQFLKSDGKTLGDPAKLPWCGDFVETCVAVTVPTEAIPVNPYLARNWLKFGVDVKPCYGSVLVFWRGSKSGISGHVGFYFGEDASAYHVLGGNQSNAVTVARLAKSRLLGARMPKAYSDARRLIVKLDAGGKQLSVNEA